MPVEPVFFREVPDPLPGALSGQDAQPFEQMQQSDGHEQQSGLVVKEPNPSSKSVATPESAAARKQTESRRVILLRPPIPPTSAVYHFRWWTMWRIDAAMKAALAAMCAADHMPIASRQAECPAAWSSIPDQTVSRKSGTSVRSVRSNVFCR